MVVQWFNVNEFLIVTEIPLPAVPVQEMPAGLSVGSHLIVECSPGCLARVDQVQLVGLRSNGAVRAYNTGHGVLLCLPKDLRVHVDRCGARIRLDFDAADAGARCFASGCTVNLGVSLCTLFRGGIPLHGASVVIGGRRIALLAHSGTGKTTLLWRLLDNGARFANDDVVPTWVEQDRVIAAAAGGLHAKLSRAALEERGLNPGHFPAVLPGGDEFWVPMGMHNRVVGWGPLDAVFVLQPSVFRPIDGPVHASRLSVGAAMAVLMEHSQMLWAGYSVMDGRRSMETYCSLARNVPVFILKYRRDLGVLADLVRTIEYLSKAAAAPGRRRRTSFQPVRAL